MAIIKRLYLYAVSAVSLLVLSVGFYNLAALVLGELGDALGASVIGGDSTGREQVSLAIALVVVGLPIFAIHWWLVGRDWRGTDDAGLDDRQSAIRAFHTGLVATVGLAVGTYATLQLLDRGFGAILGADREGGRPSDQLAMLLVTVPVCWYHQRRRNLDLRHDRLTRAAAWITRVHRYGWLFIGLLFLVFGISQVIGALASVAIGRADFGSADWWRGSLAGSLASIVTGAGLFWLHADDARRVIRDAAVVGEDDRATALRATYFGGVLLVSLAFVGLPVTGSIAELLRRLLGVADEDGAAAVLELVVGPLLVAIPFAVAGWLHWGAQRREAADLGPSSLAAARRLGQHLAALAGLALLTVGTARLIGALLDRILGSVGSDDFFRYELASFTAQVVAGVALWVPAWLAILRGRAAAPAVERHAATARAYLFLVVAAALITVVPSTAFTLYRLIDMLLGGRGAGLASELAMPIAAILVAGVVAAYHGRLVVADLRSAPGAAAASDAASTTALPVAVTALPVATLMLTMHGPGGTDLVAVANTLREHLPAGIVLE